MRHKKVLGLSLAALVVTCTLFGMSWVKSSKAQTTADGSVNVGFGDGSVRFISDRIAYTTWNHALQFCLGVKDDLIRKQDALAKLTVSLRDSKGNILVERDFTKSGTPGFQCMLISNSEIPGQREPSGRIQLWVREEMRLEGLQSSDIVHSIAVLDEETGQDRIRPFSDFLLHTHFPTT
jgi:prepilin-type processing-associated H-X9-DG protein